MANKLYNLARVGTATSGTGTITLGAAVSGYLTLALAGVANGDTVSYGIKDGANSEVGTGVYSSAGPTLTRTVTKSTNANAAIALSGAAEVFITMRAEDVLLGTSTNDNAAAGYIGEIIESTVLVGAAIAATNATTHNVTSISLTAGDWDVWAVLALAPGGGTANTKIVTSISTVSATEPTIPNGGAFALSNFPSSASNDVVPVGMKRISIATTTTVFLTGRAHFTGGTQALYGYLGARRVR